MKTKKIRIAVAVDGNGDWSAVGWSGADPAEVRGIVLEGVSGAAEEHIVWVVAEVPIPEQSSLDIEGTVEKVE